MADYTELAQRAARLGSADEIDDGEAAELLVACADAITTLIAERDACKGSAAYLRERLRALVTAAREYRLWSPIATAGLGIGKARRRELTAALDAALREAP